MTIAKRELEYARNRVEHAEFLFNNCDEGMLEYANAEMTAASEYLRYILRINKGMLV